MNTLQREITSTFTSLNTKLETDLEFLGRAAALGNVDERAERVIVILDNVDLMGGRNNRLDRRRHLHIERDGHVSRRVDGGSSDREGNANALAGRFELGHVAKENESKNKLLDKKERENDKIRSKTIR